MTDLQTVEEVKPNEVKPDEKQADWQPLIDAVSPHAAEILTKFMDNSRAKYVGTMTLEKWIIGLGFFIVGTIGISSVVAVFMGHFETAERLCIPLISFAGGLGIGARLSRPSGNNG